MKKSDFKLVKNEKDYIQCFKDENANGVNGIVKALEKIENSFLSNPSKKHCAYAAEFANWFMIHYGQDALLMNTLCEKTGKIPHILEAGIQLFAEKNADDKIEKYKKLNKNQKHDVHLLFNYFMDKECRRDAYAFSLDGPRIGFRVESSPTKDEQDMLFHMILTCYFQDGDIVFRFISPRSDTINGFRLRDTKITSIAVDELSQITEKEIKDKIGNNSTYELAPLVFLG